MRTTRTLFWKAIAFVGIIAVFRIAAGETPQSFHGYFDLRAGLLVFIAPLFVLILFQKQSIHWPALVNRMRQTFKINTPDLIQELERNTPLARGQFGFAHVVKWSENHSDSIVRYSGELYAARFQSDEIAKLLVQKIQSEDTQWQALCAASGFLAKMAPYFGMLATVMGMIKLLEHMTDFTQISGSMALAMQGTLYGLVSFTLVYSPLQRFFMDFREQNLKRNEAIARWFVQVAQQADPTYIQQDLRTFEFSSRSQQATARPATAHSPSGSTSHTWSTP